MDGFKRPGSNRAGTPPARSVTPRPNVSAPRQSQGYRETGQRLVAAQPSSGATPTPRQSITDDASSSTSAPPPSPRRKKRTMWLILGLLLLLILITIGAVVYWYQKQLEPLTTQGPGTQQRVEVKKGDTWSTIGDALAEKKIVRNGIAFALAARLHGSELQQGTCTVESSQSTNDIIVKFAKGCHDFKSITFYPGATIEKPLYKPDHAEMEQTMYVKNVLSKAGFSDEQIKKALAKQYDSPLFKDKPANATLEGYIYGETYYVDSSASAEDVLNTAFAHMYKEIKTNDLEAKFKAQGLNLFQGIIMSSIVQRELNCEGKPTPERRERCYQYQRTIAQIFLKRYKERTSLGSDVTFIYAADMMGVTPRVDIDSPYNLRKNTGLTPGPIATPGIHAMRAVGDPTPTDYHFFIAGDDGLIYFARTDAEHQANIKNHCQKLCSEL